MEKAGYIRVQSQTDRQSEHVVREGEKAEHGKVGCGGMAHGGVKWGSCDGLEGPLMDGRPRAELGSQRRRHVTNLFSWHH